MSDKPIIRNAAPADSEHAQRLYDLARHSLNASGIDQWQGIYPNADDFLADVDARHAVVIEYHGSVIGVAAAYIGHEPTYDSISSGKWLTDHTVYGIIHRIAVDPASRNSGAATAVVAYLHALCIQQGVTSMRCDTHPDNLIMQHTLEKNGYRKCGIILVEDGSERFAYEKLL